MASRRFVLFYPFRPCGSFDFSRIGLRTSGGVCRFCQLVFLRRLLVAGAYRFPLLATLVRSSRSSSRLARLVWRLVAIFFLRLAFRLVRRFVSRCSSCSSFIGALSRRFILPRLVAICLVRSVSSSNPYSLVSLGGSFQRLVGRVVSSLSLVSFFFCSRLIRLLRLMAMMETARLSHLVAACSHPVAPSWDPIWR